MSDRFDFEQQIFAVWNVTNDINALLYGVVDTGMTQDQIANALLGMHQLYELKFTKLMGMYEKLLSQGEL